MNPPKIINDPVHGFIQIRSDLIYEIVKHPYFQRLRRIKQLGLTDLVYPGAVHTRFQHALGAFHLMSQSLDILRLKGVEISDKEYESAQIAILLHDIGHGPLSHTLESRIISKYSHESIGYMIMKELNRQFDNELDLALKIFRNSYHRPFLNQLVCSQLDVDRLDYLVRDSYYTGVSEGNVNIARIIQLLNVVDEKLVVEEKGIYPIENFLNARRLMYWQVYLHKTALAAEKLLDNIVERVLYLEEAGAIDIQAGLQNMFRKGSELPDTEIVNMFCSFDDIDIWSNIKQWNTSKDTILSDLSDRLLKRRLPKILLSNNALSKGAITELKAEISNYFKILKSDTRFYSSHGVASNEAYISGDNGIKILNKNGTLLDISQAADLPNLKAISNVVVKYYICYPAEVPLNNT